MSRTCALVSIALALSVLAAPVAHGQDCLDTGSSFRLLTYNMQMLESPLDPGANESKFGMEHGVRAKLIAEDLLDHAPDVIVFNEVQLDEGREVLVQALSPTYRFFVSYIGNSDFQDSGLMLFSKYPFVELPSDTWVGLDSIDASADGNGWEDVAFADYDDFAEGFADDACPGHEDLCHIDDDTPGSSYPDNASSKGAALVRLEQPCTGETISVVFTHMQADYHDDDDDAYANRVFNRGFQLQAVRAVLEDSLGSELASEQVYVAGDLNVDGNPFHPETSALTEPLTEWQYHFSSATSYDDPAHGGFLACGAMPCPGMSSMLVDTWGFHTSPDDLGRTTGEGFVFPDTSRGKRLDYILRTEPSEDAVPTTCTGWTRIAWPVSGPEGDHSDHLPVEGTFNSVTPFCSAAGPRTVAVNAQGDDLFTGSLDAPGAFQWHRIDDAGTWSIGVFGDNVDLAVYASDDLSRELAPTLTEIDDMETWNLKAPPYYIRVFPTDDAGAPSASNQGPYTLNVHKHACTSAIDACFIDPTEVVDVVWPTLPMMPDDTFFYWFSTDTDSNGRFPQLVFLSTPDPQLPFTSFTPSVTQSGPPYNPVEMELRTGSNGETIGDLYELPGNSDGPRRYLLQVARGGTISPGVSKLEWRTNLTYLQSKKLYNHLEDDDTWCCDSIWTKTEVGVYNSTWVPPCEVEDTTEFTFFAEMEEGSSRAAGALGLDSAGGPLRFVDNVRFNLADDDGPGCDDHFLHQNTDTIEALDHLDAGGEWLDHHWADAQDLDDADYHYYLRYRLSHTAPN